MISYYAVTHGRNPGIYTSFRNCRYQRHPDWPWHYNVGFHVYGIHVVYTDGSCKRNGYPDAKAGYGVFWGDDNPDNVAAPLLGNVQTNNRAELQAIIVALKQAKGHNFDHVVVRTDSKYTIDCVDDYVVNWRQNRWTKTNGEPVKNVDLLIQLCNLREECYDEGMNVQLQYTASKRIYGNRKADYLAKKGADMAEFCNRSQ
ncbi:RNase H domain-containing protein [Ditylenchus destructor]|uniref:ribonuclease H n=1 Tax=Ditylenchus destructor TaxID=166010 RepID=A0AAD4NJH0_9BILA|nr:RNase H domain-containing protein [Ditylenchus destructor]